VDDPHNRNGGAEVIHVFRLAFDTGPNVAFLGRERMSMAVIDPKLALDALTQHIVSHSINSVLAPRLEEEIASHNFLVTGKDCVSSGHGAALAQVHPPNPWPDLLTLIRSIRLSHCHIG
jgi:hypothetical protein